MCAHAHVCFCLCNNCLCICNSRMHLFAWFWGVCTHTELVVESVKNWFHSLTVSCWKAHCTADTFSNQWPANDVDLLNFIFTFSFVREEGGNRHTHVLLVYAHSPAHPPPVTVMTLTFLFVMMCVGYVYLWGADRFLLIGSLLPPHKRPAITHEHTHTQCRLECGESGVGGVLFIKETLNTQLPSTDTAITTQHTC